MKTIKELVKEHGLEGEEGVEQDYNAVMQEVLQSCFQLCVEGVSEFRKQKLPKEADGCDACAANIVELAKEHGIDLEIKTV